ncbi:hypothetical protein [Nostoc sp.]
MPDDITDFNPNAMSKCGGAATPVVDIAQIPNYFKMFNKCSVSLRQYL